MMTRSLAAVFLFSLAGAGAGAQAPPPIELTVQVAAPAAEVWSAWTTVEGATTFFARAAEIEPRVDGRYDILFFPANPPGQRGAEGMRILAFEPPQRLMFSWNAPPHLAHARAQRAVVEVRLRPLSEQRTEVELRHFGWGEGEHWQATRAYFAQAWPLVLRRLTHRFAHGPVDWDALPADLRAP